MTRILSTALPVLTAALLTAGCNGDGELTDDTDVDTDSDTEAPPRLVSITGMTMELLSPTTPAPEGLCARAVEPTEALDGGELTLLGESTVGADGSFTITDVNLDDAPLAIFVVLTDCDNSGTIAFPAGTGIASDSYADNVAGDTLTRDSFWVSAQSQAGINQSLVTAGSDKSASDGLVLMFVTDAQNNPLPGATVSCAGDGCDDLEAYYLDTDPEDGLFTTAGEGGLVVNEATVAGLAVIPAGPVANYTANAEGQTFSSSLFGSIPGLAAVTQVSAE